VSSKTEPWQVKNKRKEMKRVNHYC